ncbi:ribosome silencing factor [Demequina pelophila]|uniref:ribosome silencing factor n=1 Tax=Demequina pelophila TaxID=1638984 RepID=UPI0007827AC3|nr:ribosome silencing factor [Demequina pelophila]
MAATEHALELTRVAARAADDKKAHSIVALDVSGLSPMADTFVIASASNERQVVAIAEAVEEELAKHDAHALVREGVREGHWALLHFADLTVHVMHDEDRAYYELERLYKDCPVIALDLEPGE